MHVCCTYPKKIDSDAEEVAVVVEVSPEIAQKIEFASKLSNLVYSKYYSSSNTNMNFVSSDIIDGVESVTELRSEGE